MGQAFLGLTLLAVILWVHGIYTWRQAEKPEMSKGAKTLLTVTTVLTAAAWIAGVVGILCHMEPAMPYAMGLIAMLLSLWADYQIRRICGK